LPAADALLARHESTKLRDYVAQLSRPAAAGFQDNQDFISAIADYTRETLGAELGEAIAADLRELPQVLTANHHGIDTFAQSTQSNLLFSMRGEAGDRPARTIPVLACGSVPLNNLTYPRGLLIYAASPGSAPGGIRRLPLFPDSYKRKLVSVAAPFTAEMLRRGRNRANRLVADDKLGRDLGSALNTVFDDFARVGQDFRNYARQATVVNHRFWQRLFRDRFNRSELVCIGLEDIVSRLLQKDLFAPSTICHQLMFDPQLRRQLVAKLDGQRGCWQYEKLRQSCSALPATPGATGSDSARGTMFFWGVDAKGRKIPLCVSDDETGSGVDLRGIDDAGQTWTVPFTPSDIAREIEGGRLLPSIFTSYLMLSIARGVSCIGGYYQADYLPIMRQAVLETLHGDSAETMKSGVIGQLKPDPYLSGMQMIGLDIDGHLIPAGPLEIIASGGLDADQFERIGEITVLQAHIASLYDTVMDVVPLHGDILSTRDGITRLARDAVGDKIVTFSLD